ncbi:MULTISPECIES: antitoxin Xre/MbcA/ParS toxin-binding domain-containing protein [Stenotrophomonas maltophilia group]|uniref:antitoxin Xre/MbcA/ParS toxin-binding domain-containing protein n=1 Tax=Stenotrophomonas maltophilia group TaxID=995085 RepID=UPI001072D612|nr:MULTISPECIES: antitoxin Xre/MbcA/ParS toxin-binding domain-containing protein [Stenotrophomonas maltophilia group]MCF3496295.1 DUF2384 domain-containing protein [Stenotrophomonas maltophilia]MDQ4678871.1 DUF2384 domain-containing protein [Stenotrophomonas maltophilia group sp. RNC7]UGB21819.1 DUF2384 domain-containing protein [Stenotrophomonas maltophilia]
MSSQFSENNPRLAGPALKAFSEIAQAWSLTTSEQLSILGLAAGGGDVCLDAVAMGERSTQAIQRISYVIGIYRALHTIFPNRLQANAWVRQVNSGALFKGETALAVMCSGGTDGLSSVRQYLEAGGMIDV